MNNKRQLPRLDPAFYRGPAYVFWTYTLDGRATGWLNRRFYYEFRELMLHAQSRYMLSCPVFVLMPDHLHFVWIGVTPDSDQLRASSFLRKQLNFLFAPLKLQRQPHDHVLTEDERVRDHFVDTVGYIRLNPERANLVERAADWPYAGALIPGYPDLKSETVAFWPTFWKCHLAYAAWLGSIRPSGG